jgi:hypothetical protein
VIDELPEAALDETTANGLTAHDLVVHMAAQESLLAQEAGVPSLPDIQESDIDARTAALLPSFDGQPVRAAVRPLAARGREQPRLGRGQRRRHGHLARHPMTRDDAIVIRAFETWIHTDDLRRVAGWDLEAPAPEELAVMSELASRILPVALALRDAEHPGKAARLVLTGDGGGDWLIPLGGVAPDDDVTPDVTLTATSSTGVASSATGSRPTISSTRGPATPTSRVTSSPPHPRSRPSDCREAEPPDQLSVGGGGVGIGSLGLFLGEQRLGGRDLGDDTVDLGVDILRRAPRLLAVDERAELFFEVVDLALGLLGLELVRAGLTDFLGLVDTLLGRLLGLVEQ